MLLVVVLVTLAVLRPWNLFDRLPFISPTTALTVNSLKGKAEVYLDGRKVGETPFSSEQLSPGDYDLEIRRISNDSDFYQPIQKTIHCELGTRTFVEAEVGPSMQFSSLKLVYYRKSSSPEASLYISTTPSSTRALIDNTSFGDTPVTTNSITPGRHTVTIEKEGYEPEETTVIAREGFTLIVEMNLMTIPIDLIQQ